MSLSKVSTPATISPLTKEVLTITHPEDPILTSGSDMATLQPTGGRSACSVSQDTRDLEHALIKKVYPTGELTLLSETDESICYLVDLPDGNRLTAKIRSSYRRLEEIDLERQIHQSLDHPGVCKWIGCEFSTETNLYVTFTEFAEGLSCHDLIERVGALPADKVLDIAKQVLEACAYLHAPHQHPEYPKSIVHRDINPKNLVLDSEGNIKVIDFGIATQRKSSTYVTLRNAGTPGYTPPEINTLTPLPQSDIYSVGATLLHLILGDLPNSLKNIAPISPSQYHIPTSLRVSLSEGQEPQQIPASLRKFLQKTIMLDSGERFSSADEALAELQRVERDLNAARSASPAAAVTEAGGTPESTLCDARQPSSSFAEDEAQLRTLAEKLWLDDSVSDLLSNDPVLGPLVAEARTSRLSVATLEKYLRPAALFVGQDQDPCTTVSELIARYRPYLGREAIQAEIVAHTDATLSKNWLSRSRPAQELCEKQLALEVSEEPNNLLLSLVVGALACNRNLTYLENKELSWKAEDPTRFLYSARVKARYERAIITQIDNLETITDASFRFGRAANGTLHICLQRPDGSMRFLDTGIRSREENLSFEQIQTSCTKSLGRGLLPADLVLLPEGTELFANYVYRETKDLPSGNPGDWLESVKQAQKTIEVETEQRHEQLKIWRETVFRFTNSIDDSKQFIHVEALAKLFEQEKQSYTRAFLGTPGSLKVGDDGTVWRAFVQEGGRNPASLPAARLMAVNNKIVLVPVSRVPVVSTSNVLKAALSSVGSLFRSAKSREFHERCKVLKEEAVAAFRAVVSEGWYRHCLATVYLCRDGSLHYIIEEKPEVYRLHRSLFDCFFSNDDLRVDYLHKGDGREVYFDKHSLDPMERIIYNRKRRTLRLIDKGK